MTLDEAIRHADEVAEKQDKAAKEWHENQVRKCELLPFAEMNYTHENECKKCAEEHRQLAEWLKDYKWLKEQEPCDKPQQEIIRCKDCKHWTNNIGNSELRDNYCNEETHGFYYQCSGDDYCSFAERKTDDLNLIELAERSE